MLSEKDLRQMRLATTEAMPSRASLERLFTAPDGYGNQTEQYSRIAWVNCRIDAAKAGHEDTQGSKTTANAEYDAFLPYGTDIQSTDRLVIGTTIFEVIEPTPPTGWDISNKVRVKKVL